MKLLPPFLIKTNLGVITVKLLPEHAPITVQNFLAYAKDRFYDNTLVHRVVDDFCVQGGGFAPGMVRRYTRRSIPSEAKNGLRNDEGMLAMSREPHDPHSATSQWFINTRLNEHLNHRGTTPELFGYCVFGEVIDGLRIVQEIESLPVHTVDGNENVPTQEVVIESIRPLKKPKT